MPRVNETINHGEGNLSRWQRGFVTKRYRQMIRLLCLIECFGENPLPCEVSVLQAEVNKRTGEDYCERTIRRDLQFLTMLDAVKEDRSLIGEQTKWRWKGFGFEFSRGEDD